MSGSPFVGREDELEKLTNAVSDDDTASLIPVVGATGIGKSTLLSRFVGQCRDQEYRVLRYELNEPASVEQFLTRLLDHWQDVHPSVVSSGSSSAVKNLIGSIGRSLSNTPGTGTSLVGGAMNAFAGEDNEAEVPDITSKLLELAVKTRDKSPANRFILVIDQFDEARINQDVYEKIATLLREIAKDAPTGVVCCVGARQRFYDSLDANVKGVDLQPLDVEDIREYLGALGLETSAAQHVHDATSGSPYFVERIGQIAIETGGVNAVLADLSEVEAERRRMLEERFLDILDGFSKRLLRETCFLPELRPRPVSYILEADIAEVEQALRDLERRSILTKLGYSKGNPVYRLHGLHREFLRERLTDEDRASQHARAAGYFTIELANTGTGDLTELLTEEGVQRQREHMTAGVMFEYHLQQFPRRMDASERVRWAFESVPEQEPSPRDAALSYFKGYRNYSIAAETLGITPAVDAKSIKTALSDRSTETRSDDAQLEVIIRGLRADDTLNDDQTEVFLKIVEGGFEARLVTDADADSEEVLERLEKKREQLTTEKFPDAPEMCKMGRVAIDLLREVVTEEDELNKAWTTIEQEYDVTNDDLQVLWDAIGETASCLLNWSLLEAELEKNDGNLSTSPQLEGDTSIEEEGMERSLLKNLSSPLFLGYRALQTPNDDDLQLLSETWSELETRFENDEIYFLAAFCRDARETFVEPISAEATKTRVGLQLMNAIRLQEWEFTNYEPVDTIGTIMQAVNGVVEEDPERER